MSYAKKRAIIFGAGPIGLITAWKLLENGWDVEIYEKESIVGGMCRTWKWEYFLVETGPHIFHTPDEKLAKFWQSEFGDLFIHGEFWCKNVKGDNFNQYWDYPLSWEGISRYPRMLKERVFSELSNLNSEAKAEARNYNRYMEAQVGHTLVELFFKKYPEKIWGISTDEMTPDWAPKRIEFRRKITPFYHGQWNAVGKFGVGCIFERIRDKVLDLGGIIYFNSMITGIQFKDKIITALRFSDEKLREIDTRDVIISSLPITTLAGFLGYESKLRFRGVKTVFLAYNRKSILPEGIHWLYYDSEKVYFNRISEPKKFSPFMAPDTMTYLSVETTYGKGDVIDTMESDIFIRRVAEQVQMVGLANVSDLIKCEINNEDFVYPIHFLGYQDELAKTRSHISQFRQIYTLGTGGEFNYADIQVLFHKAFDTVAVLSNKDSTYTQVIKQSPLCKLNSTVIVNGRQIGNGTRAYIVAEAGLNHNGSLQLAKQLIEAAEKTRCDAIKFQTFKASSRISNKVKTVKYAETIIGLEETLFEMFERLSMSFEMQAELFTYAREKGLEVFSTPFDFESVDFLESQGVNVYKIASMDLVNIPFIKYVAQTKKPIILSTGMSTLGQIEEAVDAVIQEGNPNLILLHCNSSYPAAPEEMNLNTIKTLKKCFNVPVGLSDHTFGLCVSQIALAVGADVIERHFTLDRMMEGPDHILSSDPNEFSELVRMSYKIPSILGDGVKQIKPNEYETINTQRKCLYAACNIEAGQIVNKDMVAIKGPGGGILPKYLDIVVGRVAKVDIQADYPITWESI